MLGGVRISRWCPYGVLALWWYGLWLLGGTGYASCGGLFLAGVPGLLKFLLTER